MERSQFISSLKNPRNYSVSLDILILCINFKNINNHFKLKSIVMVSYSAAKKKMGRLAYLIKTKFALQGWVFGVFFLMGSPAYRRSENLIT